MQYPPVDQIIIGTTAAAAVAWGAWRGRLLSRSGGLTSFLLGAIVFSIGGIAWSVPLLAFFIPSSLLSLQRANRVGADRLGPIVHSGRDGWQVAANGGVAGLITVAWMVNHHDYLFPLYCASLAAAAADTWGTEIGARFGGRTITLPRFIRVAPGASGGLSREGSFGAVIGGGVVALAAMPWLVSPSRDVSLIAGCGIVGMLVDSLLGSTVQRICRCAICGALTDRSDHCDTPAVPQSGVRFIDNDVVNLLATASATFIACLLLLSLD